MRIRVRNGWLASGIALLAALTFTACAAGDNGGDAPGRDNPGDGTADNGVTGKPTMPTRLILASVQSTDSAASAIPAVLDGMLTQAFDSIPGITYLPLSEQEKFRADVRSEGDSAVPIDRIVDGLSADGVISLRIARFGSLIGVDMGVYDPVSGEPYFHDRGFSFIRFRTDNDTKLMGPALYEALQRCVGRWLKIPDFEELVISARPLIVTNVEIGRDPGLGMISEKRVEISKDGVRAMGDFMRAKFREFVVLDYESRSRVYETVGLALVEDHSAVGDLERDAMFRLDIPYYLTTGVYPAAGDSVEIRAEVRYVTSRSADSLIDSESRTFARANLESSEVLKNTISAILKVADAAMERQADRLRREYAESIRN